jgi:hypothetical protein
VPDHDLSEFDELTEAEELKLALRNATEALSKAKRRNEALVAATIQGSRDAMAALGPIPAVPKPKLDIRGVPSTKEEVAFWHLTDWQGSKVTTSYNTEVMKERIRKYCTKAQNLTGIQRSHHPVRKCLIYFGGDMGEGLFQFPQQPFEIDLTLFQQYAQIARLEVEVVRYALATYEEVEVVSEWGNHGRIGSKRATVPLADNFDRMTYELARALIQDSPNADRVKWVDSEEDIQHIEIGNYRALGIHGDEVGRNGFASRSTVVRRCNDWMAGAHDWTFKDVYVGHYHFHGEDPLSNGWGSVYWTGSPESDSRYASDKIGAGSRPSQRLHFIDPEKGRVTVPYRVWLD